MQRRDGVPQLAEAVLDVVAPLPLQRVVVSPLVVGGATLAENIPDEPQIKLSQIRAFAVYALLTIYNPKLLVYGHSDMA